MDIQVPKLIKGFYESIKEENPDLTLQQIEDMVTSPYKMVRDDMEAGEFSMSRLTEFGCFFVFPNRAKYMEVAAKKRLEKGLITQQEFDDLAQKVKTFLDGDPQL